MMTRRFGYLLAGGLLCSAVALASPDEDGDAGISAFAEGDLVGAIDLLYSGAQGGYAPAQAQLAYILDQSEEDEEAAQWYERAAAQGNAEGQFGLGSMYAKGEGVEQDLARAAELTLLAAEQGHLLAMRTYALALEHGNLGIAVDHAASLAWFRRAADAGDTVAVRRLAQAYERGELGLQIDPVEASRRRAALKPQ